MIAALAAACAVWRIPLFGAGLPFFGNLVLFFHPLYAQATRQLMAGAFPAWNPYESFGLPLLADPQAGVLSPAHVVYRLFFFSAAYRLDLLADLALMGCGAFALARRLGLRRLGATLTAVVFSCGGFAYYHSGMLAHVDSLAFMPVVLAFWVADRPLLAGLSLALQCFGGHPFFTYMTLAAGLLLRPPFAWRRAGVALAAAAACAAALLLPQAALFSRAARSGALSPDALFVYSLSPDALWRMLVVPWWNRDPWAFTGDPTITSFYIGLPALLLALAGAWRRRLPGAAWLALLSLLLCLGPAFPLYPALARLVPGLALFRFPAQWGATATLALAVLAGEGLSVLPRRARAAAVLLVLADLAVFCSVSPTARADERLLRLRPPVVGQEPLASGARIAHTPRYLASEAAASEAATPEDFERSWASLIKDLAPSHGTVFGVREAVSDNIARPRVQRELLDAALSQPSPPLALLRAAGVGVLVDAGPRGPSMTTLPAPLPRLSFAGPAGGSGRLVVDRPDRVSGLVSSAGGGLAVLSDSFAPGWSVWVDGRPAAALRVDGFLRACAVPSGTHAVDWRYAPAPLLWGLAVTLAALCALGVACY